MTDVWIAGARMTCFGKRRETLPDVMAETAIAAKDSPGCPSSGPIRPPPSGMVAVHAGFAAVAASLHATVAAVGGEKMTHLSTPPVPEVIGRSIDPHERSCGSTMPVLVGLVTRAAMHRRGCEKMSAIGKSLVKGFWKGRDRGER